MFETVVFPDLCLVRMYFPIYIVDYSSVTLNVTSIAATTSSGVSRT